MKTSLLLLFTLVSTTVFSADWTRLQNTADRRLKGVMFHVPETSYTTDTVLRVELNRTELPIERVRSMVDDATDSAGEFLAGHDYTDLVPDVDRVEMFIYTKKEVVDCLAVFKDQEFDKISHCHIKKIK